MKQYTRPLTMVLSLLAALLVGGTVAAAPGDPTPLPGTATTYAFPTNVPVFPEGIAYHAATGSFFVGSTADGTVYRGNIRDGKRELVPFLPGGQDGRTAVTGMKVAPNGYLWVSGAATGRLWLYDALTGKNLLNIYTGTANTFINDVALAPDYRAAYFTDSNSPFIYRVALDAQGLWQYELWLDLAGSPIVYGTGFNLNGIAATPDGRYLIAVQSNTGKLFRISTTTKEVVEIDTAGQTLMLGDGIWLDGQTLYVLRNQMNLLVRVQMSADYASGVITGQFTDPSFHYTTAVVQAGKRFLVVNSQFDKRGPGLTPTFPFTISNVAMPQP